MSPGKLNKRVIGDRLAWLDKMVAEIRALPLESYEEFTSTLKNVWAAESCLRRALESIFDLGRHILAKGFGIGVTEYKQIASELEKAGVLSHSQARLLTTLAGYRPIGVLNLAVRKTRSVCHRFLAISSPIHPIFSARRTALLTIDGDRFNLRATSAPLIESRLTAKWHSISAPCPQKR